MPILSICISTYNRSSKVCRLVNQLLLYEGGELEVVVSDNSSTDDTVEQLAKINDSRLRVLKNQNNIGAIPNYLKAVSNARGDYVVFSTDKDSVISNGLTDLINLFKNNTNIFGGFCALDVHEKIDNLFFKPGLDGLINIGYLSRHPTGYFFKNQILKELLRREDYSNIQKFGSFPFEFIIAEICVKGMTAVLNIPLFYIETIEEVKSIKSYSYSGAKKNLYFSPAERIEMFQRYLRHLNSLKLSFIEEKIIIKHLYRGCLSLVTIRYRLILSNKIICDHYGIKTKKIGLVNYILNDYKLTKSFILNSRVSNVFCKVLLCFEVHLKSIFLMLKW